VNIVKVRKTILVLTWASSVAAAVLAQDSGTTWTFSDFQTAVVAVRLSDNSDENERAILNQISSSLGQLRDRYIQRYGENSQDASSLARNLSQEYSRSMAANISSLRSLGDDHAERLAVLEDLNKDLSTKVAFFSHALGATGSFPSVISVTVKTVDAKGNDASGLWVRCNPRRYGVTNHPIFVFNSATTPTTASLPPGSFVFWVEDSTKKVLLSQPVQLGLAGQTSEQIRLALP
jgi:hypothetical protein